ncbi:unnamed protein product [Spirodela intermedia]|uniref:Uncharacterized protein n=1 Tax=Spirodela intermedia TaxID=51605 RepID=A0A7I8JGE5_SPIIN|nr:unnamed protein product [Spirodela intermedia]CAA6669031.1 unnamed protein product [Spirodela intermedia]
MEVSWELEDDLFFADLSERIALLIMEEKDDDDDGGGAAEEFFWRRRREGIPFQAFAAAPPSLPERPGVRGIRGTGVFIPQSSLPRRKPRNGKSTHPGKPKPAAAAPAAKPCGHRHRKPARELRW